MNSEQTPVIDLFRAHWHTFGFLSFMLSSFIQIVIDSQFETGSFSPVLWGIGAVLFFFGAITLIDMVTRFVIDALQLVKRL